MGSVGAMNSSVSKEKKVDLWVHMWTKDSIAVGFGGEQPAGHRRRQPCVEHRGLVVVARTCCDGACPASCLVVAIQICHGEDRGGPDGPAEGRSSRRSVRYSGGCEFLGEGEEEGRSHTGERQGCARRERGGCRGVKCVTLKCVTLEAAQWRHFWHFKVCHIKIIRLQVKCRARKAQLGYQESTT